MASSYALPASVMAHSHSHNGHAHSHSASPSRHPANTPRSLRQEKSNGSLHAYSASDSHLGHIHEHPSSPHYEREASPYDTSSFEQQNLQSANIQSPGLDPFGMTDDMPASLNSYQPPLSSANVLPNDHSHGGHTHTNVASARPRSKFTSFILPYTLLSPLLHTIIADEDSRRIFYFMCLNFAFMMIQACYGFLTDSLGLLSDSIHMFFDCLALGVGLFASVASKWPPSEQYPYGFGKIEALSGFGNGIFLMLISVEIITEAVERLAEGRETKRLGELFVVSAMGLAVNLVGMAAFGHHGHDHGGHSHGHSHGQEHSHSHDEKHSHDGEHHHHEHSSDCDHNHGVGNDILSEKSPSKTHSHAGQHSHGGHFHDNENMYGIWLHILADTMGSAAVMVSTVLIRFTGWYGWDPTASCVIAILIFMSSIPLVARSAKKLLLAVPDQIEYSLRDALGGVGELRGVASYSVPRFWMGDKNIDSESEQILGVIHIIATRGSDLDEVKDRVRAHLLGHGMDVVVQVEKDGDSSCWCGGNSTASRTTSRFS